MTDRKIISIIKLLSIIAVFTFFAILLVKQLQSYPASGKTTVQLIIDAGHGAPDGGAVAKDGTVEAELNLAIAFQLNTLFEAGDISTIMTRTDENGLHLNAPSIKSKKVADIKTRITIAQKHPTALFLSIHMNTFSSGSVYGAQVFYKTNSETSQKLATAVQNSINETLQPENPKLPKPIPKNVYLLNNIENEAILVECGFLTNEVELSKLKDQNYQAKLARIIYDAVSSGIKNHNN